MHNAHNVHSNVYVLSTYKRRKRYILLSITAEFWCTMQRKKYEDKCLLHPTGVNLNRDTCVTTLFLKVITCIFIAGSRFMNQPTAVNLILQLFFNQRSRNQRENTSVQLNGYTTHTECVSLICVCVVFECVTLYLITVNQSETHAWLHDVKALRCKKKCSIELFELLSEGLNPHTYISPSFTFSLHL